MRLNATTNEHNNSFESDLAKRCAPYPDRWREIWDVFSREAASESEKAALQNAVTTTDAEIDHLVYELYGLTEEEIKIVEGES
jgi:hypothetical protein